MANSSKPNNRPRKSQISRGAPSDAVAPSWAQGGETLTTATGVPVDDTDNSLRVGERGPTLLDDFHLREKIMHFDHERIPERVVHARGAGAHGVFRLTTSIENLTCAPVLCDTSVDTPVFTRFSTVAGSRGSADTARDVRGFAVRFYTTEGNWDLVGNNIPVFFIQDGIKFPDLIHAAKPEPDREIPQAATAHDTFWDFASLAPESTHMLMWLMSDRAIPRSFRTMEGFGVHTFRLVNAKGKTTLVKFHWKPTAGKASLVWEEAQKLSGIDPDFHRRDLWDCIEAGVFPEWELGIQVFPDNKEQTFHGIDLLDPTKLIPEELSPVQIIGRMTLNANPTNYFAETEQVAFCTAHVPRGIDFTDDPLLQARNFSYLDTQLTRLGGPNFDQLPINRPHSPVNTTQRDGFGQQAIPEGISAYNPNSLGGGCPFPAGMAGYVSVPRDVTGPRIRKRAASFSDHFSQATLYWESMSTPEQDHIVGAFSFELGKCLSEEVRDRMLVNLANVSSELTKRVAANLGKPSPRSKAIPGAKISPALSLVPTEPGPTAGCVVGVYAADGVDSAGLNALSKALQSAGIFVTVIASHGGTIKSDTEQVAVNKTALVTCSVEYDALVIAGGDGVDMLANDPYIAMNISEAYRHYKPIAAWGAGMNILKSCGISADLPGVVTAKTPTRAFNSSFVEAIGWHRYWERDDASPTSQE
jgi:catalase